ncbi:MAG: hypothetical protein RIS19_251, partial [Actinomycetota bacterium]
AALCNNEFVKNDVWPILKDETWSCTWRYAGGVVSDIQEGDGYLDWYCSGMGSGLGNGDETGELGYAQEGEVTDELFAFRSIVFLFVIATAIYELVISRKAHPDDVLELRISAGLGVLTGAVFAFAPLDELNAVGFLSAYLALSAVQRAVWAATPTNRKKSKNG